MMILDYSFKYFTKNGEIEANVDLSTLKDKEVDESLFKRGINEFSFTLPQSGNNVTFKLLTHGDEQKIEAEMKGLKKINPNSSSDITTRLKYMITSVEGKRDAKDIRNFIDNYMLAQDSRALREYYLKVSPDVNMTYMPEHEDYTGEGIDLPISIDFFWPDARI